MASLIVFADSLIKMSFRRDIVDRGGKVNDAGCRYKWNWEWVDRDFVLDSDFGNTQSVRYGDWIRKIDEPGTAYCILCLTTLKYSAKGFVAIANHAGTQIHRQRIGDRCSNSSLPGK